MCAPQEVTDTHNYPTRPGALVLQDRAQRAPLAHTHLYWRARPSFKIKIAQT